MTSCRRTELIYAWLPNYFMHESQLTSAWAPTAAGVNGQLLGASAPIISCLSTQLMDAGGSNVCWGAWPALQAWGLHGEEPFWDTHPWIRDLLDPSTPPEVWGQCWISTTWIYNKMLFLWGTRQSSAGGLELQTVTWKLQIQFPPS